MASYLQKILRVIIKQMFMRGKNNVSTPKYADLNVLKSTCCLGSVMFRSSTKIGKKFLAISSYRKPELLRKLKNTCLQQLRADGFQKIKNAAFFGKKNFWTFTTGVCLCLPDDFPLWSREDQSNFEEDLAKTYQKNKGRSDRFITVDF